MTPPKSQKQETLDNIIEMVSRNDERIKSLIQSNENFAEELTEITNELDQVKLSLESYKLQVDNLNSFWGKIFDGGWKISLMILGAAILYFLRLQSPPN